MKVDDINNNRNLFINIIFNIFGNILPILAGIISVPYVINGLGVESYSILTLSWVVIGYFSVCDIGIGRALTQRLSKVASKIGRQEYNFIENAIIFTFIIGLFGISVLYFLSPIIVSILNVPEHLENEFLDSLYIVSFSLPFIATFSTVRGILEAYQRFDVISAFRIVFGTSIFVVPVIVLHFSNSVSNIISFLVLLRIFECILILFVCHFKVVYLKFNWELNFSVIRSLLKFGGWVTISNLLGPFILYTDRFIIGTIGSLKLVAFYSTPFDVFLRLMFLPSAIVGVIFPALSANIEQDDGRAKSIFMAGMMSAAAIMFPLVLIISTYSYEVLSFWIDKDFADNAHSVLKILSIGAFLNTFLYFPTAFLHAKNRPDATGKLHIVEAPLVILATAIFVYFWGINGAGMAWSLKSFIELLILLYLVKRLVVVDVNPMHICIIICLAIVFLLIPTCVNLSSTEKINFIVISVCLFNGCLFFVCLDAKERAIVFIRGKSLLKRKKL